MIWRHLIVLLFLSVGTVLPTPLSQWDYRITGRIPVELPAVKTGTYQRPPVRLEIPRTERDVCEPGRIAIKLRTTYPSEAVRQRLQLFGTRQMVPLLDKQTHSALQQQALDLNRIFIAHFDAGFDPFDVAAALMELPDIEYACPLYIRRTFRQPNDPLFPQQSALARIQMPSAWDVTLGSPDVVIAIIDSGTDYEHEDLSANLWTNPGETGTDPQGRDKRTNGIDDDGNGKIDDWRGWDFVGNVTRNEYLAGTVREDNDPKVRTTMTEEMQHGTYSAGAAIAVTDNSRGIASPAGFRCRFLPIKCGSDDPSLAGSVLRGYEAILYAARLGAAVINCSWGGPGASPLEQQIIDQAHTLGALVIASAGNESVDLEQQPLYPACYAGVFAVGATASTSDQVASFSNTGAPVAAYAPGVSIRTTRSNNAYTAVEGTSFSAPLVSGVAALVRSLHPNWTAEQVAAQLRYTCDQITGISGSQRWQFYGRINAARALSVNRSFDSGERIPGVRAIAATVNGSTTILSEEGTLQIRLRNLLATARDVRVQLSVSSNATVGQTQLTASNLGTLEERTVETTIRLGTPLYFFDGTVTVSLTITADGIVEYATFALPIALTTTNVYTRLASQQPHSFVAVATRGLAGIWAIGRTPSGRALVYRSNGSISDSTSLSGTLTTLAIVSNATVCIGTEN
ncbi:MAG: S8 family serine peptidase, partial [Chlorobi bacterium]|nr:S8 family serine peptidase [Chlorobiota bacterium]